MADATHYVIRGGVEGRERLRVLGRVISLATSRIRNRGPFALSQSVLRRGAEARRRSEHRAASAEPAAPKRISRHRRVDRAADGLQGEAKLIPPITLENIAGPVLEDGLATREDIDATVELYEFAEDPSTLAGMPRVVQVSGRLAA
jgi:hypothetical protein